MCMQLSSHNSSINTKSRSTPMTNKTPLVLYADMVKHGTSRSIFYNDYHMYNTKISHYKFEHTPADTYINVANSAEITTNDKHYQLKKCHTVQGIIH